MKCIEKSNKELNLINKKKEKRKKMNNKEREMIYE